MTGYHAWVFPFMMLMFHTIFFFGCGWSLKSEAKVAASLMYFWMAEDFLWFVLNPHYGIGKFSRMDIPWHRHRWLLFMPVDYWLFLFASSMLFRYSA